MEMWNLQELYVQKATLEGLLSSEERQSTIEHLQERIDEIDKEINKIVKQNNGASE